MPGHQVFLCGSCAEIPVVWVRDVRYFTAHWEDLGRLPPQGCLQTVGGSTAEVTAWYVGVPPAGRGEGRGVPTSLAAITQSHSTSLPEPLWNSMYCWIGKEDSAGKLSLWKQ